MEFLKPRIMDNGTEYYLAGEVQLCIEQAAKQIEETHSAYKELNDIIRKYKYKRCLKLSEYCFLKSYIAYCERDAKSWARWLNWKDRWLCIAYKFKVETNNGLTDNFTRRI